jgi:hypothetical protein
VAVFYFSAGKCFLFYFLFQEEQLCLGLASMEDLIQQGADVN